jgi:serine/threonine protein kinase
MLRSTEARASRELVRGSVVGRYTIVQRLARGGMAEVYLAHETGPGGVERLLALKLILPHMAGEPQFLSMFVNEVRVAATLHHPNVAQVFDFGEVDGEPYLAMEFVHGATVQSLLRRATEQSVPVPLGCALAIAIAACAGLHYAHERVDLGGAPMHIVHRDVAPSNLMCRYDGAVKLLDFGIAKVASQTTATATGVFKGKAGYMSPEQCSDEPLDRRSDVFNLGILLYELTTMRRAFYGDNPVAVLNKIAHGRFAPPSQIAADYPEDLERIVLRAMATSAEDRHPTAEALQLELESFVRAHRLDASNVALARLMHSLYGEQPYPALPRDRSEAVVTVAPFVDDPLSQSTTSPRIVRRRGRRLGVAMASVAVGVLALWTWPRDEVGRDEVTPSSSPTESPAPLSSAAQASHLVAAPEPAPAHAAAKNPAPVVPIEAVASPAAAAEASPKPVVRRSRDSRAAKPERKKPRTEVRAKPAKRTGPSGMYP